jgi:hypothetical protein
MIRLLRHLVVSSAAVADDFRKVDVALKALEEFC